MNISKVSFGHISKVAYAKLLGKEAETQNPIYSKIADDLHNFKPVNFYDFNENYTQMLGHVEDYAIDVVKVFKCNPEEMRVRCNSLYPNRDIFMKTTPEEKETLEKFPMEDSHIISSWLIANRIQKRDAETLEGKKTPPNIWGEGRQVFDKK